MTKGVVEVVVHCEGVSPLLMNKPADTLLEELRTGVRKSKVKDLPQEEEAGSKIYHANGSGSPAGIPVKNFFSCLVEAGRHVDFEARKKISTATSTLLPSFLTIKERFLEFDKRMTWVVDMQAGKGGTGRDRVMVCLCRPRFDTWGFTVTLEVDTGQINLDRVRRLVEFAGTRVGLCDFRPACRGMYGRFKIADWRGQNGKLVEA